MVSNPLSADTLVRILRDEGLEVIEYRDWRTNNRNHVGNWGPVHGVMIHHTVTSGTENTVRLCYEGRSDLPGPLCHGVIAKDGRVFLVGNGRANHAGLGDGDVLQAVIDETDLPSDNQANTDGNTFFYGFECENLGDGVDPWPAVQLDAIIKVSVAISRVHGWTEASTIGHLEWQPGKVDPRGVSMDSLRTEIRNRLKESEETMPSRIVLGTKDYAQIIEPHKWTQLKFNRVLTSDGWEDREPAATILVGAAYYALTAGLEVESLVPGQEFQIRFVINEKRNGEWVRAANFPISSPTHDKMAGKFVHVWNGFVPGHSSSRVCLEVYHMGEANISVGNARVEGLYWKD